MSLITLGKAPFDDNFQTRCWAACHQISRDINAGITVMDDTPFNLTTDDASRNLAAKIVATDEKISRQTIASYVLQNGVIAAAPDISTDGDLQDQDILWQVKQVWRQMARIG